MLLDEPTNHLDLDALVWLEAWLQRYEGTMIVISHDREFLDAVTRVTLHLDEAQLTRYGGNYTTFEEMRAERISQQQAAYSRQQEKIAQLSRFIERFKAKATKARQAQSRVKALARMEKLAPVLTSADFSFEFREPLNLPNPMLSFDGVSCGYPATQPGAQPARIVEGIDRSVLAGQRIGILGANGQGKSTLVKTIARVLQPLAGRIVEGKGLVIGYFAQQELDVLRPGDGPLEHMVRLARDVGPPAREQELRDFLGNFRFTGDMVRQAVGTLSGGEKARLVLAMLVWQRPNLLLLDEPTNHLDLATREALSMALNEYEGTVMLVSHDRALLREVCDEFWLVARGRVEPFDGDLDDYQKWLLEQAREAARAAKSAAASQAAAPGVAEAPLSGSPGAGDGSADRGAHGSSTDATRAGNAKWADAARSAERKSAEAPRSADRKAAAQARARIAERTRPLRTEIERIDRELAQRAEERARLLDGLARGDLPAAEIAEHGRRLKRIDDESATLEDRWLSLTGEIEAIAGETAG
jgi:ATP-binding cassette subfamily F protein 3